MKFKPFLEFRLFQGIIITVNVLDQHSIVDYDSVIKKHSFTRLDLLLAIVFSALIRERITWIGIYLVDVLLNGSILNSSIEYPSKVCI